MGGRGIKRGALEIFRTVGPKSVVYRGETCFFVFYLGSSLRLESDRRVVSATHVGITPMIPEELQNARILNAASLAATGELREIW